MQDLSAPGLDGVSFDVRAGEILGIGGLPDSGKDILGEALFGLCERAAASRSTAGSSVRSIPRASIRSGMSFVPADRRRAGGLLSMSVANNVVSASLPRFSIAGVLRRGAIKREARAQVARLDARISRLGQKLGTLSGGNLAEDNSRAQSRHQSARADPARADSRHRRGRKGGNLFAPARHRRRRRGGSLDLLRNPRIDNECRTRTRIAWRSDFGELTKAGINEEAILARAMAS